MSTGPALIDDTVPDSAETALPDLDEALAAAPAAGDLSGRWHGDVWKVVAALALHHPELSLRTIVEVGNCQTLVWRRDAASPVTPLDETTLDQIRDLRYEDVMASGIPEFFAGGSEDEVIAQCLSEIGPRAWIRSYS